MRVIAGTCRSMPLRTLPGNNTRPTTDRIKETLFNIMQLDVPGSRFLDLYAGSGAIGIEALSRGASHCVFVEQDRQAVRVITDNLRFTKLDKSAEVMHTDAASALRVLDGRARAGLLAPFDIVFMDPPYDQELEKESLLYLAGSCLLAEGALIVAEASMDTDFSYLAEAGYTVRKEKRYKTNKHMFLHPAVES